MTDELMVEAANNNHVKLSEVQLIHNEFGAPLEECYKLAVKFYKEKEKTGDLIVSYHDRVKLMALNKQVRKYVSRKFCTFFRRSLLLLQYIKAVLFTLLLHLARSY
ncbi:unnamed protein product [Haemonchus placei]|uniref:FERM domain-containing protein n=1 Tax=Haemonchus placei TaxID=6290 RepID=A0A0N4WE61_HAEPC|nr:unnamed protein product [Haemonchus placei]